MKKLSIFVRISGLIVCTLFSSALLARNWEIYKIPGAKCGSGSQYKVWVDVQDPHKLAVEFMGGGACWSKETCYGKKLKAWMFNIPRFPSLSVFASQKAKRTPTYNHSMIYFPYCTGDVHAGDHTATYLKGRVVHHRGKDNIRRTLNFLKAKGILDFSKMTEAVVYGASAGALGAILHTKTFDEYLTPGIKKVLIADAPGLHFGKTFWGKFTDKLFNDYKDAFRFLLDVKREEGHIAQHLPQVCNKISHWDVGILQGARDIIMSKVFGNIEPEKHKELLYGPLGAYNQASHAKNCSTWAPDTKMHTFLVFGPVARKIEAGGKNANEFLFDIYNGKLDVNYK